MIIKSIRLYFLSKSKLINALYFIFALFLGLLILVIFSLFSNGEVGISNVKYLDYFELLAPMAVPLSVAPTALNPYYITGFADGESYFYIGISPDSRSKLGYRVKLSFQIGLHEKDLAL